MIYGISGKKNAGKDTVASIIQYLLWKKDVEKGLKSISNINLEDFERVGDILSGWKRVRFADKLKDCVCLLIGCNREDLENHTFKEEELGEEWWYIKQEVDKLLISYDKNNKILMNLIDNAHHKLIKLTPRLILQLLGTECGRQIIHPDIWVNATMANYKPISGTMDVRRSRETFPNWIISDVRFPNEVEAIKRVGGKLIRVVRPGDIPTSNHISETALDSYTNWQYIIVNDGTINKELIDKVAIILKCENLL